MIKKLNQDQLFTAATLIFGAIFLVLTGVLARFDHIFYDASRYLAFKKAPEDIVIIAIDERSLDTIGKWPWDRKVHANLLNILNLAKPKAVGIDIFFSEPDALHPESDQVLADAILSSNKYVLPMVIEVPYQGARILQNHSMTLLKGADIGRVNVPLDIDGIARGIYLWEAVSEDGKSVLGQPHFSYAVLKVAGQLPAKFEKKSPLLTLNQYKNNLPSRLAHSDEKKIQFFGPPGHFKQLSYSKVLSGEVPSSYFDNKIVLIGATAVGMGDVLATPVSGFSKPMAGVEFHANAIESIRKNQLTTVASQVVICIFSVILSVIPVFWLPRLKPLKSLMIILIYLVFVASLTIFLPLILNFWLPTSSAMFMILLAYPIWSWRRLERAQTFLNLELQHLNQDLQQFGLPTLNVEFKKNQQTEDVFQSRIAQVKRAANLLRELNKNRNDTLSFISHDIRMPLVTALMLINAPDFLSQKNKILQMLTRANRLADNFLQISRAEVISPAQFKELELNGLMQEVVDQVYSMAHSKNINVQLTLNPSPIWMQGEFSLLQRAFENVVMNAVKYSPENSIVDVVITKDNQLANIAFIDQGVGIAPEKIPQLFKRFSRLEETERAEKGSGLGLYFVDLAVNKHGGKIEVESLVGESTTFIITLPTTLT